MNERTPSVETRLTSEEAAALFTTGKPIPPGVYVAVQFRIPADFVSAQP